MPEPPGVPDPSGVSGSSVGTGPIGVPESQQDSSASSFSGLVRSFPIDSVDFEVRLGFAEGILRTISLGLSAPGSPMIRIVAFISSRETVGVSCANAAGTLIANVATSIHRRADPMMD